MPESREPADEADVCIIGAGPAGAILAAELAERGHEVVVLEAGQRFDLRNHQERMERYLRPAHDDLEVWEMGGPRDAFTSSGMVEYTLNAARVKGVGGSTLHWGAMTPRLHPQDFEMNTRHGVARDWPITYDDLEPYYLRAEHEMGVAGAPNRFAGPRSGSYPMSPFPFSYSDRLVEDACENLGIELHPIPRAINSAPNDGRSECVGFGTCKPVCPSGAKYTADVHARRAERAGARIIDQVPVQRLEHDQTGDRVTAAVYVTPAGVEHRQAARSFVVACGAVETARLLLLSESTAYPNGLANSSGAVGRCFMEHPVVKVRGEMDEPTRQHLIGYPTSMTEQFYEYDSGPEGTMIIQPGNTAGKPPVTAALHQRPLTGKMLDDGALAPFEGKIGGDTVVQSVREQSTNQIELLGWVEMLPDPANRVTLDRSKTDDHGNPVPELTFSIGGHARKTLERVESVLREILTEMKATTLTTTVPPDDPAFTHHHMGTTPMGTNAEMSVVGPNLRTHDLSNLYISSSSVFVTSGAANPTLTIAALTLRLADHLHERWTTS